MYGELRYKLEAEHKGFRKIPESRSALFCLKRSLYE
jgi:hypothetical protein